MVIGVGTQRLHRLVPAGGRSRVADYIALTKPRIIELLLVTTVPAMLLAARGLPSVELLVATLVGGTGAAGSANALNCYLDRDIDAVMKRTADRPLNRASVSPRNALVFGVLLGLVSVVLLAVTTTMLAAALAAVAIAFYVVVYTGLLKRRTSQNIVWGGAAGCMPVLIGWAAVTGSLSWTPLVLFAVVFLWTPPHFWALAMQFRDDYAAAGVPMLPVVASADVVTSRMVYYTWLTVAASLLLGPVAGLTPAYEVVALLAGAWFLRSVYQLRSRVSAALSLRALSVFHASISYLTIVCVAASIAAVLPARWG